MKKLSKIRLKHKIIIIIIIINPYILVKLKINLLKIVLGINYQHF